MGMYTDVSGWVEFSDMELVGYSAEQIYMNCVVKGGEVKKAVLDFMSLPRFDCISFSFEFAEAINGVPRWRMSVAADMKNYNYEVETFLNEVLPLIAHNWDITVKHDMWERPISATREGGYDPSQAVWED